MADDDQTTLGKQSKITVGLAIACAGSLAYITSDHSLLANTVARIDKLEASREKNMAEYVRTSKRIEKWLAAIGQKLRIPEPRD